MCNASSIERSREPNDPPDVVREFPSSAGPRASMTVGLPPSSGWNRSVTAPASRQPAAWIRS